MDEITEEQLKRESEIIRQITDDALGSIYAEVKAAALIDALARRGLEIVRERV